MINGIFFNKRSGLEPTPEPNLNLGELYDELQRTLASAEKARQSSAFLARISARLSSSLDLRVNLTRVGQLCVPLLGDLCVIELVDSKESLERVYVACGDPGLSPFVELLNKLPVTSLCKNTRAKVLNLGNPVILNSLTSSQACQEFGIEFFIRSMMVVPLTVREKAMGVITFLIVQSDRIFGQEDLNLAQEVAWRSALCIDSCRLYSETKAAVSARDEFFSVVSHELKTPLTALSLRNQLLQKSPVHEGQSWLSSEKIKALLESSNQNLKQLSRLIDDLLDVAAISNGRLSMHMDFLDLSEVIRDVVNRFSDQLSLGGGSIKMDIVNSCPLRFDRLRIMQVLENFLSNEVKYAPGKPVEVVLKDLGTEIELSVQDFGKGIPKRDHERIFQRFERSEATAGKAKGLGLGLYIVSQIVHAHFGSIHVESEPGQGTKFVVRLPKG